MTNALAQLFFVRAEERDWARFLGGAATIGWLARELAARRQKPRPLDRVPLALREEVARIVGDLLAGEPGMGLIRLLGDRALSTRVRQSAAQVLVQLLSTPWPARLDALLASLSLSPSSTPYEALAALLPRFDGLGALAAHARTLGIDDPSREMFVLRRMLFERRVVLRAERAVSAPSAAPAP